MWPMSSILMPVCSIFFPPVTSMSTWLAAQGLRVNGRGCARGMHTALRHCDMGEAAAAPCHTRCPTH
jgi:hypothetical protein